MPAMRLTSLRDWVGVVTMTVSLTRARLSWASFSCLSFDSLMADAFA